MADFKRDNQRKSRDRSPRRFGERGSSWKGSGRFDRRDSGEFGRRSFNRSERTKVICATCKQECEVPFKPTSDKPVYCSDCFKKSSKSKGSSVDLTEINQKLDKIMEALKILTGE